MNEQEYYNAKYDNEYYNMIKRMQQKGLHTQITATLYRIAKDDEFKNQGYADAYPYGAMIIIHHHH